MFHVFLILLAAAPCLNLDNLCEVIVETVVGIFMFAVHTLLVVHALQQFLFLLLLLQHTIHRKVHNFHVNFLANVPCKECLYTGTNIVCL